MYLHVRLKPVVTELSLQQNMGSCQRERGDCRFEKAEGVLSVVRGPLSVMEREQKQGVRIQN
jgi:hypothetical protein